MLFELIAVVDRRSGRRISDALLAAGAMSVSSGPDGTKTRIQALADETALDALKPLFHPHEYTVNPVGEKDWVNEWTAQFTPVTVDGVCVITSPENPVESGLPVIIIDPRDAFGSGTHPTTVICLSLLKEFVDFRRDSVSHLTMLDAGTGSGILAIVAEKYGMGKIDAFDIDVRAVARASLNGGLNGTGRVNFFESDIAGASASGKYDLVTANLQSAVIERHISELHDLLRDDGSLIISGIWERWDAAMRDLFRSYSLEIVRAVSRESWMGYLIRKSSGMPRGKK